MPNDVNWGCKDCIYYVDGYCFKYEIEVKEWDLCSEWEVAEDE